MKLFRLQTFNDEMVYRHILYTEGNISKEHSSKYYLISTTYTMVISGEFDLKDTEFYIL